MLLLLLLLLLLLYYYQFSTWLMDELFCIGCRFSFSFGFGLDFFVLQILCYLLFSLYNKIDARHAV